MRYADYYESTFINAVLAAQHPETGMVTYFQPQAAGYAKVFGRELDEFWCDHGTGIESFTTLDDFIYAEDGASVHVTMFRSSTLRSPASNLRLTQAANLPGDPTVRFHVAALDCGRVAPGATLRPRVPEWVDGVPELIVNGRPADVPSLVQDGFVVVPVTADDRIDYRVPAAVRAIDTSDKADWVAFRYGPVLLAAELGRDTVEDTYTTGVLVRMGIPAVSPRGNVFVEDPQRWKDAVRTNVVRIPEGPNGNGLETLRFALKNVDDESAALVLETIASTVRGTRRTSRSSCPTRRRRRR